ncbi:MAG: DNA-deoxyinosine glycosylase [Victivallaceae bacterium]
MNNKTTASSDCLLSFSPSAAPDAEILILGSMPGIESLRQQQYYAHPRNIFWKIMGIMFNFDEALPYPQRMEVLLQNRIALWDTVHSCVRSGSLDSAIRQVEPNDFEALLERCPHIRRICFNGQAASNLFFKHTGKMKLPQLEHIVLPSTSPANAAMPYAKKLSLWAAAIKP